MSLIDKLNKSRKNSTKQLIKAASIEDCCLTNNSGEKIGYLVVSPVNLNVQSTSNIQSLVDGLTKSLEDIGSADYLCINSVQSYESNKRYLTQRAAQEKNDTLKNLDIMDIEFFDDIQIHMATSRLFLIVLTFNVHDSIPQISSTLEKAQQVMKENNFYVTVADKLVIKRLLSIYFEQNIYEDDMQDFDGQRYASILEMKK